MNIIFMGTPEFAVPSLEALIRNHNVVAVVTQPDRPKGRGNKVTPPPIKQLAQQNNISVFQPEKIRDKNFIAKLGEFNADVFVVVAYGRILPESVLKMPKLACINVHGSLLPKYRGAAPIEWAIINGEHKTGITIMHMEKTLDTGDMILKKELEILEEDNAGTVSLKMAKLGAEALIEALCQLENNTAKRETQIESEATYAPMLIPETGKIDWSKNSKQIINLIKGLTPARSAYTICKSVTMKIKKAEVFESNMNLTSKKCGEIIEIIKKQGFVVKTGDGAVLVKAIQIQGKKEVSVSDFLLGNRLDVSEILL